MVPFRVHFLVYVLIYAETISLESALKVLTGDLTKKAWCLLLIHAQRKYLFVLPVSPYAGLIKLKYCLGSHRTTFGSLAHSWRRIRHDGIYAYELQICLLRHAQRPRHPMHILGNAENNS